MASSITNTGGGSGWVGSSAGTATAEVYWDTNSTTATDVHFGNGGAGGTAGAVFTNGNGAGGIGYANQHVPITFNNVVVKYTPPVVKKLTKAEKRKQEEHRKRVEVARIEAQKKLETAKEKGDLLLKNIIGDILFKTYKDVGHVDVMSVERPDVKYRIRPRRSIGILRKVKGKWLEKESLCIHPSSAYVEGDVAAIHVLLCKYDEKKLWKDANLHRMAA